MHRSERDPCTPRRRCQFDPPPLTTSGAERRRLGRSEAIRWSAENVREAKDG